MKRHLLTAALAIVALGGAVASTTNRSVTQAGPLNSSAPCTQTVACHIGSGQPCTFDNVQYGFNNDDTGLCDIQLARDVQ